MKLPPLILRILILSIEAWPRPPNFLLVDYYNHGSSPGSVFQVAAQHNNVTYDRPCCGKVPSAAHAKRPCNAVMGLAAVLVVLQVAFRS